MKYCEKCGRKVDTDTDICPYCGAPLREMQDGELSEEELLLLLGLLLRKPLVGLNRRFGEQLERTKLIG